MKEFNTIALLKKSTQQPINLRKVNLFGKNKSVPVKRFPKEIFKPTINIRRRILANERLNLNTFSFNSKAPLEAASTHNHSSKFQPSETLELNKKIRAVFSSDYKFVHNTLHSTRLLLGHKADQYVNLKTLRIIINKTIGRYDEGMLKKGPLVVCLEKERLRRNKEKSVGVSTERKLKTVKRTVYSSQGGTIKILLPINFITDSTKESDVSKTVFDVSSIKLPNKLSPFLNKIVKESKYKSRRNVEVNEKGNTESIVELCNVTFGMREFKRVIKT